MIIRIVIGTQIVFFITLTRITITKWNLIWGRILYMRSFSSPSKGARIVVSGIGGIGNPKRQRAFLFNDKNASAYVAANQHIVFHGLEYQLNTIHIFRWTAISHLLYFDHIRVHFWSISTYKHEENLCAGIQHDKYNLWLHEWDCVDFLTHLVWKFLFCC